MKLNTEPIINWFGFSRRERRATFILLVLIVLVIGIRSAFPDSRVIVRDITGNVISDEELATASGTKYTPGQGSSSFKAKDADHTRYKEKRSSDYRAINVAGKPSVRENRVQYSSVHKKPLIDINSSDSATLVRLPGIGPVLSARIIKYRRLLGGFARIEQLKEVYGLPEETFELIRGRVYADSAFITRMNINTADYKELAHLHYLEKYEITAILKYRQLRGKIDNIMELTENKLISAEKARKVSPYLKYDE